VGIKMICPYCNVVVIIEKQFGIMRYKCGACGGIANLSDGKARQMVQKQKDENAGMDELMIFDLMSDGEIG
jgi:Zn-finger nucleic acid-binding protein